MTAEPSPSERPRQRGPRRDAITNQRRLNAAALEVFARLGTKAQLEDIAQHAGVGVGTAYRHLGSREAALSMALDIRITELVTITDEAEQIDDPWEAFSWYLGQLAARVAGDRGLMALLSHRGVGADQIRRLHEQIEPRTAGLLERARASGQLRSDVSFTDLPLLLTCFDRIAEETKTIAPDTWQRLLCIVLDGLRAQRTSVITMTAPPLTAGQLGQIGTATPSRRRR